MFEFYDELLALSEYVPLTDLLTHGLDLSKPDAHGRFVLEPLCESLRLDMVRELIAAGADVNSKGSTGFTPLLSAIDRAHHDPDKAVKLVELLLDSGADIEGRGDWDKTPFLKSCTRGIKELTHLLVLRGCDIHATAAEIGGPTDARGFAELASNSREFRLYVAGLFSS